MKFTLAWLKQHLDTKAGVETIADTLTRIGLEVEKLFDPAKSLAPFRVAEVVKCEKHPNADKLSVCEVDTGKERVQVVCGAPNARAGMKGVFAPVGSYVPGIDLTLTKVKIRGVESFGMLLSERELELSDEHTGIIELDPQAKIGSPAAAALGLDDAVIEVAITPNRPDCLGVRGIARDLAAAGLGKLKKDAGQAGQGQLPQSDPDQARIRQSERRCVSGVRRPAGARREERALPRLAATPAQGDWAQADQRAGRHHQLHRLRPRPAASCL